MAKLVLISDTHTYHTDLKMPEGDILICSGDYTWKGEIPEVRRFLKWLKELPYKYKIFCNGNHEVEVSKLGNLTRLLVMELKVDNIFYLEDQSVTLEGLKFYGSPRTPAFGWGWAYMYDRRRDGKRIWENIPEDTDILITHGPPYNKLDLTSDGDLAGCRDLLYKVLKVKPKLHIFGHIHLQGGSHIPTEHTLFVNAAMNDDSYLNVRKPVVVDTDTWEVVR
jgi:Icc-related predicted phosphoesterase